MINVNFRRRGEEYEMRMTGHAGTDEKGKDLVCAAASCLAFTLAQSVAFFDGEGKCQEKPISDFKDGKAVVRCKPKKEDEAECLHTFFVIQTGFFMLEHNFPQAVSLKGFTAPDDGD